VDAELACELASGVGGHDLGDLASSGVRAALAGAGRLVLAAGVTCAGGPLDAARIANEAGFAKRNNSAVLASLTACGVIKAAWAGNERHFAAYRERWALLFGLAGPADMPSFVSWVHLLPAALEIITWLDEKAETAESEYLIASQARRLMNRLTRDLEAAGIEIQHRQQAHGTAYLPVFAETSNALLTRLGAAH